MVMGSMRRIFAPALTSLALMTSNSQVVSALIAAVTRYLHSAFLAVFPVLHLPPKYNARSNWVEVVWRIDRVATADPPEPVALGCATASSISAERSVQSDP